MELVVDVPQAVLDQAILDLLVAEGGLGAGAGKVRGHARHVLHAAGDLGLGETELDVLGGEDDGLHARGADFVDCDCFDGGGEAGEDGGLTGGGLADAGLEDVAHVDIGDFRDGDFGLLEGGLDRYSS